MIFYTISTCVSLVSLFFAYKLCKFFNTKAMKFKQSFIQLNDGIKKKYLLTASTEKLAVYAFLPSNAEVKTKEYFIDTDKDFKDVAVYERDTGKYIGHRTRYDFRILSESDHKALYCLPIESSDSIDKTIAELLTREKNKKVIEDLIDSYYDKIISEREKELNKKFEELQVHKNNLLNKDSYRVELFHSNNEAEVFSQKHSKTRK